MREASRMQNTDPLASPDVRPKTALEPLYRVLVHNDDVTPYDYVIAVLMTLFKLSHELAEHITWVAHTRGLARVVTRPRSEAQRLINRAHSVARQDGFPLTFSLEPEE